MMVMIWAAEVALHRLDRYNATQRGEVKAPPKVDLADWILVHDCPNNPKSGLNSKSLSGCLTPSSVPKTEWDAYHGLRHIDVGSGKTRVLAHYYSWYVPHPSDSTRYSYQSASRYRKTFEAGEQLPVEADFFPTIVNPMAQLPEVPYESIIKTIDPLSFPQTAAAVMPAPIPFKFVPYRRHQPDRAYYYQYEAGNNVPNVKGEAPAKGQAAYPTLEPSITFEPNAPAVRGNSSHMRRPPQRGDKEKKVRNLGGLGVALRFANKVTEYKDIVDELYKHIPDDLKPRFKNTKFERKKVSTFEKAQVIYNNFDQIKIVDAAFGLAMMEIEDRIYGAVGKAQGQAARELGLNVSLDFQGAYRRAMQQEALRKSKKDD